MQHIPSEVRSLVEVAVVNNPRMITDLDKIVRTHSCHSADAPDLAEHIAALVVSELPGVESRVSLRREAFRAGRVDDGVKCLKRAVVREVERWEGGYNICRSDGVSIRLPFADDGYEPKVGSEIWSYVIGRSSWGVIVDGHVFFYKVESSRYFLEKIKAFARERSEERARFPEHDEEISQLPEIFQQRIKKFQLAPCFREEYETYEIFVCKQATLLAERFETVQRLLEWEQLEEDRKLEIVPELKETSYNIIEKASTFAKLYLEAPQAILEEPGAMVPRFARQEFYLPIEDCVCW